MILIALFAVTQYLTGTTVWAQAPSITSLSNSTLAQAGRLKITGKNFGATQGTSYVTIGGFSAPVSNWTATSITAYVPDSSPLGVDQVQVVTSTGSSNTQPLTVTKRVVNGRVLWRFQVQDLYIQGRPGIGPDGTIYTLSINGHLFALTPDGGVKWIFNVVYGSVQSVSVGNDGTIYFAGLNVIYAINPDGTLKWKVTDPSGSLVDVGPTVGPDGNIYAVTDDAGLQGGLGAISISPAGNIIWNIPGFVHANGEAGQTKEVVFGSGQLYFEMNNINNNTNGLQAVTLGGNIQWTQPGTGQPAVAPDGTVYVISAYLTNSYAQISSYDPQGNLIHNYFGNGTTNLTYPDVGSDGNFYVGQNLSTLMAVKPSGDIKWQIAESGILGGPIVSNGNTLVAVGGYNIGFPGYVTAASTAGSTVWTVNLPFENGGSVRPMSRPRFSTNDSMVYVGMDVNDGAQDVYTYLYAFNAGPAICTAPTVSVSANGATSFCKGGNVLLSASASAGVTYQWTKNNVAISGATNATYSATTTGTYALNVTNSCGSTTSNSINVTSNKKPDATVTPSGIVNICAGQTTTLTANTGNNLSYQWIRNGTNISGATNSTYSAATAGKYKVAVTNTATGCTKNSAVTTIYITCKEAIPGGSLELQVYPNPTNDAFNLQLNDGNTYEIQISDASGRILKSYHQVKSSLLFGNDLVPGMYFLKVSSDDSLVKIIKIMKTEL